MTQWRGYNYQVEKARKEEEQLNTLGSLALSDDLANDTIRIALNIAGYNIASMNQFERASALLDIVQEYKALKEDAEIFESERVNNEGIWELTRAEEHRLAILAEDTYLLDYVKECTMEA